MERRFSELRQDGRRLTGTGIRYGDEATLPWGREVFRAGAFGDVAQLDAILNVQHRRDRPIARTNGGGLILRDDGRALEVEATLPSTREADDALELVRTKILRGLSIEFDATRERQDGNLRVVERATLFGLGLVDRPAYGGSLVQARMEVRQDGDGLEGAFFYDQDTIISDRQSPESRRRDRVRKQRVKPGAFTFALEAADREINILLGRDFDRALGSKLANSVVFDDGPDALRFRVETLPATTYVQDFRAQLAAGSALFGVAALYRIPPPEAVPEATEIVPEPDNPDVNIEIVNEAVLTALAVVARAPRGNSGEIARRAEPDKARRRLWL